MNRRLEVVLTFAFFAVAACLFPFSKLIETLRHQRWRSNDLRRAIHDRYKAISKSPEFWWHRHAGESDPRVVTDLLIKWIPPGLPFDEAEGILREAGFTVSDRVYADPGGNRPDRFDVVATLPYKGLLFGNVTLWVHLVPTSPGHFDKIEKVSGSFTVAML